MLLTASYRHLKLSMPPLAQSITALSFVAAAPITMTIVDGIRRSLPRHSSSQTMDTPRRIAPTPIWRHPKVLYSLGAVGVIALMSVGYRNQPAGLGVDASGVVIATVERGPLAVNVQGNGILLPSDIRWISALTDGRVEQVLVRAGTTVKQGDALVRLINPALIQLADETRWSLEQAVAEQNALRVSLESEALNQQATVAKAQFAYESARLQVEAEAKLLQEAIVSKLTYQRSELNLKQLEQTLALEKARIQKGEANIRAQLAAKEANVARLRKTLQRAQDQVAALTVRASMDGVVQEIALQAGQALVPGASIAKIARPDALYAELQVQEALARDLAPGQQASVDTRNGIVSGEVSRVAPKVSNGTVKVEIKLNGPLPRGARPDLSVDGTIELASLKDALQVQRPALSQGDSPASVYRVNSDGIAERIDVRFGVAAVTRIEIKQGLQPGDRIVVSDTNSWHNQARVKLK